MQIVYTVITQSYIFLHFNANTLLKMTVSINDFALNFILDKTNDLNI